MLLNGRNEVKLGDLGYSKLMERSYESKHRGSPAYMSPEVSDNKIIEKEYYPNIDIWYEVYL